MAKGLFVPTCPEKYMGDVGKIRFLSSWELRVMIFFDTNPHIKRWASEEIRIPYLKPTSARANKVHHYIPDFYVEYNDRNGALVKELVEIKPKKETYLRKNMNTYDAVQLAINRAKWTAAVAFCESAGIKFRVLTEDQLFR